VKGGEAPYARTCIPAPGVPCIQPNAAQAQAIANAASTVLRKPAAAARGGGEGAEFDESQVTDLQQDGAAAGPPMLARDFMCLHTTCPDTDAPAVRVHVSAAYVETKAPVVETRAAAITAKGERLLKGYMVSSVNEWGADQTRILLVRACVLAEGVRACRMGFEVTSVDSETDRHVPTYAPISLYHTHSHTLTLKPTRPHCRAHIHTHNGS
jgi:hypothetical protein